MNDLRRTLLWSVFAVSLLMLWDGWLRHTGQPSLFTPAPAASAVVATGASGADAGAVPQASTQLASAGGVPAAAQAASGASAVAPAQSEQVTITTDVVKATIDTLGGSLVKVELLKHQHEFRPRQP